VFVQVNTTREESKSGLRAVARVEPLVARCAALGLRVDGLMTIGPTSTDPAGTAAAFAALARMGTSLGLPSLSMGMTNDLDLALEHGATHVRIGSALFGTRPQRSGRIG